MMSDVVAYGGGKQTAAAGNASMFARRSIILQNIAGVAWRRRKYRWNARCCRVLPIGVAQSNANRRRFSMTFIAPSVGDIR